jgi:hypothetical protein
MKTTHTHRGHCQACGRLQAAANGSNVIAKHGYKVAGYGFFAGTCPGSDKLALEIDHVLTDEIIVLVTADGVRLRKLAAEFTSGKRLPEQVTTNKWVPAQYVGRRTVPGTGCHAKAPFAEGTDTQKAQAVQSAIHSCTFGAEQAEGHVKFLQGLKATVYGKALQPNKDLEVKLELVEGLSWTATNSQGNSVTYTVGKSVLRNRGFGRATERVLIEYVNHVNGKTGKYTMLPHLVRKAIAAAQG